MNQYQTFSKIGHSKLDIMNRSEAVKIIEEFTKAGGEICIDGCKGNLSDRDLILIAEQCQELLRQHQQKGD